MWKYLVLSNGGAKWEIMREGPLLKDCKPQPISRDAC